MKQEWRTLNAKFNVCRIRIAFKDKYSLKIFRSGYGPKRHLEMGVIEFLIKRFQELDSVFIKIL